MVTAVTGLRRDANLVSARRSNPAWPHVFMALFGAGGALAFEVGVRLYVAELVALLGLALLPWWSTLRRYPMAGRILGAYAIWLIATLLSDAVNETAAFDTVRNMATPVLGGLSLLFVLTAVSRNPNALLTFLAATAVAKSALGEPSYGDSFADSALSWETVEENANFFKVRIDPFLTPAVLLVACLIGRKNLLLAVPVLVLACVGYFAVDARSSGLMFFGAALALVAIEFQFRPKPGQLIAAGLVALAVGYGSYVAYVNYSLNSNKDGHNSKQLARMQNPYDPLELLIQGRSEWLVMGTAISERPVFGWGSWAIDPDRRFAYLQSERSGKLEQYDRIGKATTWGMIPVHSVIGAAWLWSGCLGLVAMLWLLHSIFTTVLRLPFSKSIALPFAAFIAIQIVWNFFFSPPQVVRLSFPVALATLIALGSQQRSNRPILAEFADNERPAPIRGHRKQ